MSWWRSLFGGGERPEETMRLTRRGRDLFSEGKSHEEAERFLRKIESRKAFEEVEQPGRGLLDAPISEHGLPLESVIDLVEREVVRPGANTASGGHLAY